MHSCLIVETKYLDEIVKHLLRFDKDGQVARRSRAACIVAVIFGSGACTRAVQPQLLMGN